MSVPDKTKDFYYELEEGIFELANIFYQYKKNDNIEIELRIGQIDTSNNRFNPGLGSQDFYNKIQKVLESNKNWDKIIKTTSEELINNDIRKTLKYNNKKVIKNVCIKKNKIKTVDFTYNGTPYDIRMSVSNEIPTDEKIKTGIKREKDRTSYCHKDYRFDLTTIIQTDNTVSTTIYEMEIEFLNLKNNVSDIYRAHSGLLLMRDIINMCETITSDCKLVKYQEKSNHSSSENTMEVKMEVQMEVQMEELKIKD